MQPKANTQGLPGDGCDRACARNAHKIICGAWSIAPVKKKCFNFFFKLPPKPFIHIQLQNNAPICLQIPSKLKVTLGKSFLLPHEIPHFRHAK
jgi:hypothetical protein